MTEVSIEPVAVQAPPDTPPPLQTPPAPAPAVSEVDHTPGGWPVVPLALSGTNTTVGMVAAASLAGGPIAAAVAMTGAVALGMAAATRSRKPSPRREARRAAARAAGRTAARTAGMGGYRASGHRGGRSGAGGSGKVPGQHRRGHGSTARTTGPAGGKSGRTGTGTGTGTGRSGRTPQGKAGIRSGFGGKAAGRAGQVKALREVQKAAGGSRAERRAQKTAARRAVADARRNTNTPASKGRSGGQGGLAGRLLGGTRRKARAMQDAAVAKQRARRDAAAGRQVDAQRGALRKAPARKTARAALRRSAARFHRRRLLAALLALPLGLLGFLTSPIGRKLRLPWLVHPGRRLYQRLTGTAAQERAARDEEIRAQQREAEAAADAESAKDTTEGIAEHIERPEPTIPSTPDIEKGSSVSSSGFKFEDHATEMQAAAMLYEPDGCMEILAMVEGLPEALNMIAHVMQILAERSDSEFPLEKEVAGGFNDIYDLLRKAADGAEELPAIFRRVHAQDIARHEDPRNGSEAEKGWNV
ncbi:hypothetical protein ACFZB2_11150 [Streptomyces bobili]|uniref:hypothetical protein n=1 Tax=Streptomyces bobili TaxID=67280 RepID=UPI0036E4C8E1